MSANQHLIDAQTRHQIFQQRFGGGVWNRLEPVIRDMRSSIVARLSDGPTEFQGARLTAVLREIDDIIQSSSVELGSGLQSELFEFADYEAGFQQRMIGEAVTVDVARPTTEQLRAAVTNTPAELIQGQTVQRVTVDDMLNTFSEGRKREVGNLIRGGFLEGRTTQQMTRDVARVVDTRTRRQAEALVRTAVNHTATVARSEVYRANDDVLMGERYSATLDMRTTERCAGLDGKVFDVGVGPMTPQHYGCRSLRVPQVKPEFSVQGLEGERASIDGPVDSRVTYGGFLKRQSSEFQDQVLGPERAKLFRSGKVSIDRFTDDAGRLLTLDQLRAVEGLTL